LQPRGEAGRASHKPLRARLNFTVGPQNKCLFLPLGGSQLDKEELYERESANPSQHINIRNGKSGGDYYKYNEPSSDGSEIGRKIHEEKLAKDRQAILQKMAEAKQKMAEAEQLELKLAAQAKAERDAKRDARKQAKIEEQKAARLAEIEWRIKSRRCIICGQHFGLFETKVKVTLVEVGVSQAGTSITHQRCYAKGHYIKYTLR